MRSGNSSFQRNDTMKGNISQAVIKRMPRYYRYLGELMDSGIERISSKELSTKMNVTASQIRQDLNNFGGFGQQGYGYNVRNLYGEIGKILGLTRSYNLVIVGAGNIGQAIANYEKFEKRGFVTRALFDVRDDLEGRIIRDARIYPIEEFEDYLDKNDVDIVALTVPKSAAVDIAEVAISKGVRAIWNFAHVDLEVPEGVVVQNVHLLDSLMQLSYMIGSENAEGK